MIKLTLEDKFICTKKKVRVSRIKYLIRLIDIHGYDILRNHNNKSYPRYVREDVIKSVLENDIVLH